MERIHRLLTRKPIKQVECTGTITCPCPDCELRDTFRQRRMVKRMRKDAKRLLKEAR